MTGSELGPLKKQLVTEEHEVQLKLDALQLAQAIGLESEDALPLLNAIGARAGITPADNETIIEALQNIAVSLGAHQSIGPTVRLAHDSDILGAVVFDSKTDDREFGEPKKGDSQKTGWLDLINHDRINSDTPVSKVIYLSRFLVDQAFGLSTHKIVQSGEPMTLQERMHVTKGSLLGAWAAGIGFLETASISGFSRSSVHNHLREMRLAVADRVERPVIEEGVETALGFDERIRVVVRPSSPRFKYNREDTK